MAKLTIRSGLFFESSNPENIETVRSCLYEMNRVKEIHLEIPIMILGQIYLSLRLNFIHCVLEIAGSVSELNFRSMKISSATQNACNVLS